MSHSPQLPPTLRSYSDRAQREMSPENRVYFLGGAGGERTQNRNLQAFAAAEILPRTLRKMDGGGTQTTVLGQVLSSPILVAPFAYQKLLDPSGEVATAQGAEAQSVPMVLSAQSSVSMETVRTASPTCDWFQIYWLGSRDATLTLALRAIEAGFTTLVFTVDAPVQGVRDREIEAGFKLPPDICAVNIDGIPQPQFDRVTDRDSIVFDRIASILPNWDDVKWLCKQLSAPVLIKGILHPDDAVKARDAGAQGVIVSNHGGRVLDGAPPTLKMLPAVVATVGGDFPVLMDGGIRRGADVLVALASGARAVLVGQSVVCGLAVGGAVGVSHVLRLLRDELEVAMLLSGCRTIADITPDLVHFNR